MDLTFENEEGYDAGGLQREVFNLFFQLITNEQNGIFKRNHNKTAV